MTKEATLTTVAVGRITGRFHVPGYQRGYRWGATEVGQLLDDMMAHHGSAYYLQPVVVKRRGDGWELIDGQQRLTTLFLVQQYMKDEGLQGTAAEFTLDYETRPGTTEQLEQHDPARDDENIDFAHIARARARIASWFAARETRQRDANRLYDALFEDIRVIWYEVPDDEDSVDLFTRLNVGRIPLTDAELIKASVLTQVAQKLSSDRAAEVAAQWDGFERDLQAPEFFAFLAPAWDGRATHIDLLLDTLAPEWSGNGRPAHHTFEHIRPVIEQDVEAFWDQVVEMHARLVGWFEDRELFHRIGYLTANHHTFRRLNELAGSRTRTEFVATLDASIRDDLSLSETATRELTYQDHRKATKVLMLMNVLWVMRQSYSSERYSFSAHADRSWSLEHIHARNQIDVQSVEWWRTWLRLHRDALGRRSETNDDAGRALLADVVDALDLKSLSSDTFRALRQRVNDFMSAADEPEVGDSIANLALLDSGVNSAIGNSLFPVKRAAVIERDRSGAYIPVCTRNVFLKYFSEKMDEDTQAWTGSDRAQYLAAIVDTISAYLSEEITP